MIRVSQWAEIRQMVLVEGIAKKEIGRRFGLDVKTVRRAIERAEAPRVRARAPRGRRLDPWRGEIEAWLGAEPKLTAKRIGRLLEPMAGPIPERTVRQYVARVRGQLFAKEAFVHRTHRPGQTMEVDFGESWAMIEGRLRKAKFLVATLPSSNAYFAKAYPVERLECLLDGLHAAFAFFGGVTRRVVLDNTSLAVKRILKGRERAETKAFHGFRGAYPFGADFCAPAKGWEKGSVEGGVKYVRNNVFRPMPKAESFEALNAFIERELVEDMPRRRLADGRSVVEALEEERRELRALPIHPPETCRTLARVADKFGHVQVDRIHYSVPIRWAWRPVVVKLFHDRVEVVAEGEVIARHRRSFTEGAKVLEPRHVLPLLERKHRAASEATAVEQWRLPAVFAELRAALSSCTRKPDREWIGVLRLMEKHEEKAVEAAVAEALERGSPRRQSIELLLRRAEGQPETAIEPARLEQAELAALTVAAPSLRAYDRLWESA